MDISQVECGRPRPGRREKSPPPFGGELSVQAGSTSRACLTYGALRLAN